MVPFGYNTRAMWCRQMIIYFLCFSEGYTCLFHQWFFVCPPAFQCNFQTALEYLFYHWALSEDCTFQCQYKIWCMKRGCHQLTKSSRHIHLKFFVVVEFFPGDDFPKCILCKMDFFLPWYFCSDIRNASHVIYMGLPMESVCRWEEICGSIG